MRVLAYKRMNKDKILCWFPRLLATVFIIFIGLFALDSFGTGNAWYMQLLGFLIHLTPNFLLIAALILAWRNEKIGGWAFLVLYIAAIFFFRGEMSGLILFSPLVLIGLLFINNARHSKKNK